MPLRGPGLGLYAVGHLPDRHEAFLLERSAMARKADRFQRDVGVDGVAINARHARALSEAQGSLDAAQAKMRTTADVELLASDRIYDLARGEADMLWDVQPLTEELPALLAAEFDAGGHAGPCTTRTAGRRVPRGRRPGW